MSYSQYTSIGYSDRQKNYVSNFSAFGQSSRFEAPPPLSSVTSYNSSQRELKQNGMNNTNFQSQWKSNASIGTFSQRNEVKSEQSQYPNEYKYQPLTSKITSARMFPEASKSFDSQSNQLGIYKGGISKSILLQSSEQNGYTTTGNVLYKSGEQLDQKFHPPSQKESLLKYNEMRISEQYRQPSFLAKGVYDDYYSDHSDKEMRDCLLKTVVRDNSTPMRGEIIEIFREMTLLEREVENIKQSLCLQKDLSFDQIFRFFDLEGNNQITPYELDKGFQELGIRADKIDIYLVIIRYSKDGNDTLNVDEFFRMLMPSKKDQDFDLVLVDKGITFENMCELTKQFLIKLLKMLLNQESIVQSIRKDIQKKEIDIAQLFHEFDKDHNNIISKQELISWICYNGIYINENEAQQFFQRFDRNNSGNINIMEFIQELTPKGPSNQRRQL